MKFPFTTEQFFAVFGRYNEAVWPMQVVLSTMALAFILLIFIRNKHADKLTSFSLALFWAWMGIVYHMLFFAEVNPVAVFFGAMYIVQALLFAYLAIRDRLQFAFTPGIATTLSAFFLIYALILYQLINSLVGHTYPQTPTFGLPCPTTILTFAILMLARRVPWYILIIPGLWSIIGFSAALQLNVPADWMLLGAAVIAVPIILIKRQKTQKVTPSL